MFFGVYMIMVFDPQILFNDGFYDLVDVRIPRARCSSRVSGGAVVPYACARPHLRHPRRPARPEASPEFLCAAGFSVSPHLMYSGYDQDGEWYQLYQIGFGGIPGRPFGDGPDGHSLWPSFTNVPNEFLESYFPLRIERYETSRTPAAPGCTAAATASRIGYRFLEPGEISIHDDRWFT